MNSTRENRPQKLLDWQNRLENEKIFVPRDRGALWSGIGADIAKRLAQTMNLITLEMTSVGSSIDAGQLKDELIHDFGSDWIAEKRLIFGVLSKNYVRSLTGRVTVFLPENFVRPMMGSHGAFAFNVKILWDELKEADFGDPRRALHNITSMRVCRIRGGQIVSDTIMASSDQLH